jgi:hypothetical protein
MAQPSTTDKFDRVPSRRQRGHRADATGKEALFSTAPSSAPPPPLEVRCSACDVTSGLGVTGMLCLLRPPFLVNPLNATIWSRCPSCGQRGWLDLELGQAIRALVGRTA